MGPVFSLLPHSLHCQVAQLSTSQSAVSDVSTGVEVQRVTDSLVACAVVANVLSYVSKQSNMCILSQTVALFFIVFCVHTAASATDICD